LVIHSDAAVDDSRVNPSDSITFNGTIYYEGTSTVPENITGITVKVELSGVQKGSDSSPTGGTFSISVTAESSVNLYGYNIYAVTDQNSVQNRTVNVVVDNLAVSDKGASDDRTNINEYEQYYFKLRSQYDSVEVQSGSVTLNGTLSASWIVANSRWEYNATKSSAQIQSLYVASAS
jgi:hypothetical protein